MPLLGSILLSVESPFEVLDLSSRDSTIGFKGRNFLNGVPYIAMRGHCILAKAG